MKILVLGDCASDGSNCLNKQIIGEEDNGITEYSLASNKKYRKYIVGWYLKNTKTSRGPINTDELLENALLYLQDREMQESWTSNLQDKFHVTNLSQGGATAYGYYKRLLKYEDKEGRPDIIVLTDHDPTHPWQRINLKGKKYFFEKGYDPRWPIFSINPKLKSPAEAQEMAFNKSKFYFDKGANEKRNYIIMNWFHKYLLKNQYQFIKIKFYEGFQEFDNDDNVIDCTDLAKKYAGIPKGTIGSLKLGVQNDIYLRVDKKLSELTNRKKVI